MRTRRSIAHVIASLALAISVGGSVLSGSTALAAPSQPPSVDPRVATYAQRQVIRDRYRGQIDELTFNDELGDGVSLDQALSDAMLALATPKPVRLP